MLVGYIAAISQMNDIKRFFRYHGAELRIPSGVDVDAVAVLLRSIQSL